MRNIVKYIASRTYKPLLVRYLSKTRSYSHKGILLEVPPEVFHPGFFFSTRLLLRFLEGLDLRGKRFLELGAGSGLLSIYAARKKALVTASDISSVAIRTLRKNAGLNRVEMEIVWSDLFQNISQAPFDCIVINPPYYKKDPVTEADHAWFCGKEGEYFQKLFARLRHYIAADGKVLMVLCDGCDLEMILAISRQHGFRMDCLQERKNIFEKNYIFGITAA